MDIIRPNENIESLEKGLNLRFSILLSTFLLLLIISFIFSSVTISSKKHDMRFMGFIQCIINFINYLTCFELGLPRKVRVKWSMLLPETFYLHLF